MIRVTIELPNEESIKFDIIERGKLHGWLEDDGIYDMDPDGPAIEDYFNYKVRGPGGMRYFSHHRSLGWRDCVRKAIEVVDV